MFIKVLDAILCRLHSYSMIYQAAAAKNYVYGHNSQQSAASRNIVPITTHTMHIQKQFGKLIQAHSSRPPLKAVTLYLSEYLKMYISHTLL